MVTDASLTLNSAVCNVNVLPPARIEVVATPAELPAGELLMLQFRLYNEEDQLYHNCSSLPIRWILSDGSILSNVSAAAVPEQVMQQKLPGVCMYKVMKAERAGKVRGC